MLINAIANWLKPVPVVISPVVGPPLGPPPGLGSPLWPSLGPCWGPAGPWAFPGPCGDRVLRGPWALVGGALPMGPPLGVAGALGPSGPLLGSGPAGSPTNTKKLIFPTPQQIKYFKPDHFYLNKMIFKVSRSQTRKQTHF